MLLANLRHKFRTRQTACGYAWQRPTKRALSGFASSIWSTRPYRAYLIAMPQRRCTVAPTDAPTIIPRSFCPAAMATSAI